MIINMISFFSLNFFPHYNRSSRNSKRKRGNLKRDKLFTLSTRNETRKKKKLRMISTTIKGILTREDRRTKAEEEDFQVVISDSRVHQMENALLNQLSFHQKKKL
jgi:hypothetical protein